MRFLRTLTIVMCLSAFLVAADSPFAGTWKYDAAKSKSIQPPMQSSTARVEADDTNFKISQDFVDAKGQSSTISFEGKYDGKKYPVTGNPDYIDAVSLKKIGDRTLVLTFTKSDKVVARNRFVVAKDGKSGTLHTSDLSGAKPKTGSDVYDKE